MPSLRNAAFVFSAIGLASFVAAPEHLAHAAEPTADRAAIEKIVREYLLANPEILREMADKLKASDDAKASVARADMFKSSSNDIYNSKNQVELGNPKGDVTLVEFFDYNCGYCKHALEDTNELLKSDPKLRLVLKEFPVLGQDSVDAARVAVVVNQLAPGKYLDFHRKLLGADGASGSGAMEIAQGLGVDMDKLAAGISDAKTEAALIETHTLARQLGISGTPTYVIGDQVLPGAAGADNLKTVIGNMRKCGKVECG